MVSGSPLVSVALPFLNCERTLENAVRSIQLQTFTDWELIMVNDGSKDKSLEIAEKFKDGRIKVISNGPSGGLVYSLNRAISLSNGKYFARMDADDISYPQRFEKQLRYLNEHPEIDLVGSWILVFGESGVPLGKRAGPEKHSQICASPLKGFPIAHPTYLGKLDWFKKHKYVEWAVRGEDYELLYRTCRQSNFANVQEILLGYNESNLDIKKALRSRATKINVHFKSYRSGKETIWDTASVITMQSLKALYESLAILTGLEHRLLNHRVPEKPNKTEMEQWRELIADMVPL